jgi:hypothetical protein
MEMKLFVKERKKVRKKNRREACLKHHTNLPMETQQSPSDRDTFNNERPMVTYDH